MKKSEVSWFVGTNVDSFDRETEVGKTSSLHHVASNNTDLPLLLNDFTTSFKEIQGRTYFSFPKPNHPLCEESLDDEVKVLTMFLIHFIVILNVSLNKCIITISQTKSHLHILKHIYHDTYTENLDLSSL